MKPGGLFERRRRRLDQVKGFGTLIGAGTVVEGSLRGDDNHMVYGVVRGDCELQGALVIGAGGRWEGDIRAAVVVIEGSVEGTVTADEKLELAPGAHVRGDLHSPVLSLAEGAVIEGSVHMPADAEPQHFVDRRAAPAAKKP